MRSVRGFSLIEIVIVIALVGIMSAALAMLLDGPIRGYVDAEKRAQLVDVGDTALTRMSREIRLALPNSIRVLSSGTRTAIEFLRVFEGGRYRAFPVSGLMPACGALSGLGDPLEFSCADPGFDVLGQLQRLGNIQTGSNCIGGSAYCMVVFNTGQTGGNAYAGDNIASISAVSNNTADDGSDQLTLTNARLVGGQSVFPLNSPSQRFYVIDTPVSFVCDTASGEVQRYAGYSISASQSVTPTGATQSLLVNLITSCNIQYSAGTHTRGGIATLSLTLTQPDINETVTLVQQIQIQNLP